MSDPRYPGYPGYPPPGYPPPGYPGGYPDPNARFGPGSCENQWPWAPGIDAGRRFQAPLGVQSINGLPAYDRIFRVDGLAAIAADSDGARVPYTWQTGQLGGHIVGLRAHALGVGDAASYASLGLKLTVGSANLEVFANQGGGDFVTLTCILGTNFLPSNLMRVVKGSEQWTIQFHNYSPDTEYTPELAFLFRSAEFDAQNGPNAPTG